MQLPSGLTSTTSASSFPPPNRNFVPTFAFAGAADNLQTYLLSAPAVEFNKCPVVYFFPVEPCRQNPGIVHHQQVTPFAGCRINYRNGGG